MMFSSGRSLWYFPFALVAVTFLLYSSVGFWVHERGLGGGQQYPHQLTSIFSTETIEALRKDRRLQDTLLAFTETIAESSTNLGERFRLDGLKSFGTNITESLIHFRLKQQPKLRKRQLDDLGQAFGGGLNLTNGLTGILSSLSGTTVDSLGASALFLGIGIGMGTSTGLNLTSIPEANAQATRIATANNASATGLNLVAQNLGSGLAGEMMPSFSNSRKSLGSAAFALASGIGNATAMGLKLTQQRFLPSTDSTIEALAGNFGLGLAMPIASKVDLQAMMNSLSSTGATAMLMRNLPEIAAAAGMGIGEGAKTGLGLVGTSSPPRGQKRQQPDDPLASVNISEAVGSFTRGLSQSFIQGSDLTRLNLIGGLDFSAVMNLRTMLRPLAAGAGAGIGMGFAIGLNLKGKDEAPTLGGNITGEDRQAAMIAESFVQNAVSNFLTNSTALQSAGRLVATNLFGPSSLNPAKVAEGFARGAVEGILNAMSSVGGVQNLISGNIAQDAIMNVPVLGPTEFDDSLNGSSVAFAQGLMGEGTLLIAEIVRNLTQVPSNGTSPPQRRSEDDSSNEVDIVTYPTISTRQAPSEGSTKSLLAIDAPTLQMGAQKAVDLLTCQGIGGLATAGLALMSSTKAKFGKTDETQGGTSLVATVFQRLPDGPITLTSEGNAFKIVIKQAAVEINGLKLIPFAVLTALHVVLASFAFLTFLPLYLILGVVWRFSVLAGYPVDEAKNRKWRMGFLMTFGVLGVSGIILGIVGMGNARHFRDFHGIIGLVSFIIIFPLIASSFLRLRTTLPHPSPATFAGVKPQLALAKTPQRIYLVSGGLTQLGLALGQFAFIQGFSTIRSISLCIADAVLNAPAVAGLMGFVLMIQISATGLVGIRAWLEQHIAKKEAAGVEKLTAVESGDGLRKDSIQSFGFERKDPPPPLNLAETGPQRARRSTENLEGFEDGAISAPFNVRKEGDMLSPYEDSGAETRQMYSLFPSDGPDPGENYDGRPSSDVFDQLDSPRPLIAESGPKTVGVTTADLFPPPGLQSQISQPGRGSSYSRPFAGNRPSRDKFMGFNDEDGFGRGPGGTLRDKDRGRQ
ncbi:hypothetical protein BKA66DRAFT_543869 [Pyrenochaeta sp. MPI-SDFR-AT-0127]|nr:hypothetical protein BKA66DRAFT_543869 [Pyrenochaeta sp. MPI-SDFR-AT-0127]